MKSKLDLIEDRLRRFIEGSASLVPWGKRQQLLARRLVEAMQSELHEQDGYTSIPGEYTIYLHPATLALWRTRQDLFDALANALQEAALDAGLMMASTPSIHLESDHFIPQDEFRIQPYEDATPAGSTDVLLPNAPVEDDNPADPRPDNAFLILEGSQTYPLRQAVINIGRRRDNHLVIDDPRVSRTHAQLRAVRGQYHLFDLNSTGGTFVNGQRITQQQLRPGDVISLAGYAIIYGEDNPITSGNTDNLGSTRSMGNPKKATRSDKH
jgi:hypothetical protein